ncbi:uncharacterized protein LOC144351317 [Saccoglossus kowalevskii]
MVTQGALMLAGWAAEEDDPVLKQALTNILNTGDYGDDLTEDKIDTLLDNYSYYNALQDKYHDSKAHMQDWLLQKSILETRITDAEQPLLEEELTKIAKKIELYRQLIDEIKDIIINYLNPGRERGDSYF